MDNNKEKIIVAARKVFSEKGIHCSSLGDIAKEAGVAKGTLYYYYQSKDSLVFEVMDQGIGAILNRLSTAGGEIHLSALARKLLEDMTSNRELCQIYFHLLQESFRNPAMKERFQKKYHEWRKWARDILRKHKVGDSEELSTLFIAALDGICLQWLVEPNAVDIEKLSLSLVNLLKK